MQNGSDVNAARLGDYFVLLRRQWLVILLCLALGIGAALAYLQWAPKEYRSTTSVLVTEMETDGGSTTPRGTAINLDTEAQLVTSTETVARAADVIGIPAGSAVDRVAVSVPPNTEILDISYLGSTAAAAQQGSSAFAEAYLQQREATGRQILDTQADALQDRIDAVDDQLTATLKEADKLKGTAKQRANDQASRLDAQLSTLESNQARLRTETLSPGRVITQARLPRSPSSPDPLVTLAAALLVGAAVGLGLAALRHRRDDLIRTPDDLVRRTHVPVAAVLSKPLHSGEVSLLGPLAADGRAYARLRNLVTTALGETDRRVVLVAGVRRGGGPVAANLAASLARSGEDVYLVCADVFGPTATALLDGAPRAGLAEVLAGEVTLEAGTRNIRTVPHLRVLAPGLDPDRADALLQTTGLRTLIDDMLATASYVVIEAPPTTDSPDAQTLAGVADLAVLVVEAGQSSAREVIDADAQVEAMQADVLGAVVARYEHDADPGAKRRRAAAAVPATEDDEVEETATSAEKPAAAERPAAVYGSANGSANGSSVASVTASGNGSAAPSSDDAADHEDGATTAALPTGGRPQLVPPGPAGPAQR